MGKFSDNNYLLVAKRLRDFQQSEWQEVATGGIYSPISIAQPHNQLQEVEVSFTGLPDGAEVAIYRSLVAIEVYVRTLRQKLEVDNFSRLIQTVRGVGYVLRLNK